MMSPEIMTVLADAPMAALFGYFLFLSFRQREITLTVMSDMVGGFLKTLSLCCDDDDDGDAHTPFSEVAR